MRRSLCIASIVTALLAPAIAFGAVPNSLILNEANTVSGDSFLEDDKVDPTLGRVQGNGQNWMEFVVVQGDDLGGGNFANTLDLRGWKFEWSYQKTDDVDKHGNGAMTFSNDPLWAAVPRGTLITISEWQQAWYLTNTPPAVDPFGGLQQEGGINGLGHQRGNPYNSALHTLIDLSTNTSWNPAANDWNLHVFAGERNPDTSFKYFTFSGTVTEPDGPDPDLAADVFTVGVDDDAGIFSVNNDDWRLSIKDAANNLIQGPIGEHLPPNNFGLNSSEIIKIEDFPVGTNPTQADYLATTQASYNDGASSTFGLANVWGSGGFSEDFSPLWSWWTASHPGDFDSDGDVDGADFVIWQTNFPAAGGHVLATGDADGDGDVDGADFVVWQTNFPFAPGPGASPVPEPQAWLLGLVAMVGLSFSSRTFLRARRPFSPSDVDLFPNGQAVRPLFVTSLSPGKVLY